MAVDLDTVAREIHAAAAERRAIAAVPPQILASRIRAARGDDTQANVARRAGISAAYLSKLERGRSRPTAEVLGRIAEATGYPAEAFLRADQAAPFSGASSFLDRIFSSMHSSTSSSDSGSDR